MDVDLVPLFCKNEDSGCVLNDRFRVLVSLPIPSLFLFFAKRRTTLRKWGKGPAETKLSGG